MRWLEGVRLQFDRDMGILMVVRTGQIRGWVHREQEGQGLVEYALIMILVSVVGILALTSIGNSVLSLFSSVAATLSF